MSRLTPALQLRRGLTLAELLVVMVLFAFVGTAITKTLIKQQQFYKDQGGLMKGRRELRVGSAVVPLEVRSISTSDATNGTDILSRTESEMVLRVAIGTAVVCEKTINTFTILPENLAHHTLSSWYSTPQVGDTLFAYNENMLAGAEDDLWERYAITSINKSTTACPASPLADPILDAPATKPRYVIGVAGGTLPIPDSVKVGTALRFSRVMRYRIEQVPSGKWYLMQTEYANGAWGSANAIAGPFRPFVAGDANPSGLQFRYYDTTGTRLISMTGTERVGRIDVLLRTDNGVASMPGRSGGTLKDSSMMRIAIRNSR